MGNLCFHFNQEPGQFSKNNKVILQEDYHKKILEASRLNITLTQKPGPINSDLVDDSMPDAIIKPIEDETKYLLNPNNGMDFSKKVFFSGYDESKYQFLTLEGIANITSHALMGYYGNEACPTSMITFYFYTRSKKIIANSKYVFETNDPTSAANLHYVNDRNQFIEQVSIDNSIVFIDGPIIGGNISSYTRQLITKLEKKNVLPIFFVKNSDSNLVINYYGNLRDDFNSDLHWSYQFLKSGERTRLFEYTDLRNSQNKKMFCYFKPHNFVTPQRIEFHPDTFNNFKDYINDVFDLIYYLLLVHGNTSNPQIRPIAIAENYARETIKILRPDLILHNSSLIQTMDQSRFGG